MKTERLRADHEGIARAAELILAGELVAIPTETVYGLAANAFNGCAVAKIFEAKGRPQDNPLIVHIADYSELETLVSHIPDSAKRLAEAFWPGPLTMIFPKSSAIPAQVSAGLDTVAIRFPAHPIARAIIQAAGVPLAAPSGNRSGRPSPTTAAHVLADLEGKISAVLDGGVCQVGVESTVITLCGEIPTLLRPGGVTHEQLHAVLGDVQVDRAVMERMEDGRRASSPGMKYKHYAPKAHITVIRGDLKSFTSFIKGHNPEETGVLCFDGEEKNFSFPCVTYGKKDDPQSQARNLFDALRMLDTLGVKSVMARCPNPEGLGLAVYNRLIRAAGFRMVTAGGTEEPMRLLIGLTGPTGAGKSTAAKAFAHAGCAVIDADVVARQVVEPGSKCLKELAEAFGSDIVKPNGALDRKLLAARAFITKEGQKKLGAITHPAVMERIHAQTEELFGDGYDIIVLDAPLLIESGAHKLCNTVISVLSPQEVRKQRIMVRDGLSEEVALRRMSAQKDDAYYTEHSDYILCNEHNDEALFRSALETMNRIKEVFYEKNRAPER